MSQANRLTCQGTLIAGEINQRICHVLYGCKFSVHRIPEHDVSNHFLFGDAEGGSLLRNLVFYKGRFNKTGTDGVGVDAVFCALPRKFVLYSTPVFGTVDST